MNKIASRSLLWRRRVLLPLAFAVAATAVCISMTMGGAVASGAATNVVVAQAAPATSQPSAAPQPPASPPTPQPAKPEPAPETPTPAPAVKETQPQPGEQAKPEAKEPEKTETSKEEEAEETKREEKSELDNQSCLDCHNPDILKQSEEERLENVVVEDKPLPPRPKLNYSYGQLSLSIEEKKYSEGVHADTTCVECHTGIEELPHKQRLAQVECASCHEESVEQVKASAHGEKAIAKGLSCVGCHDVHYGKGKATYAQAFQAKVCMDCHKAYGMDSAKEHANLYEYGLHVSRMGCLMCHQTKGESSVHTIPLVKTKVASCQACHTRYTILSAKKPEPTSFLAYIAQPRFINLDVLKKYGYVVGANRIPLLDTIIVLIVIGPLGLPVVHGGLRVLTRRKEPFELPEEKILLHPALERIWHWVQALCIVMLVITGIILHWPEVAPTWFDWAVTWHNVFGWAVVCVWIFWLIYNLASGRITHYIPKKGEIPGGLIKQAKFYGYGIFKHEPHPYAPSEDNKFNPLQKIAYLKFQLLLFPILLISGLLYMYPVAFAPIINAIGGMAVLGIIHYILGALFAAFLMAHLYLATTGETIGENFKAIVWGYGIKSDHDEEHHV